MAANHGSSNISSKENDERLISRAVSLYESQDALLAAVELLDNVQDKSLLSNKLPHRRCCVQQILQMGKLMKDLRQELLEDPETSGWKKQCESSAAPLPHFHQYRYRSGGAGGGDGGTHKGVKSPKTTTANHSAPTAQDEHNNNEQQEQNIPHNKQPEEKDEGHDYTYIVYYKILPSGVVKCRIDSPVEASLMVPLLAVVNEVALYPQWIPHWKIPFKVGICQACVLEQRGRANQVVRLVADFPFPLKQRDVILHAFADDDSVRTRQVGVKFQFMTASSDDPVVPPVDDKNFVRMDFDGGYLFRPCPPRHPALHNARISSNKSSAENHILLSFTMTLDPKLEKVVPRKFLNFCTRTVFGAIWRKMLRLAQQVQAGLHPVYTQLMQQEKYESLYKWMHERAKIVAGWDIPCYPLVVVAAASTIPVPVPHPPTAVKQQSTSLDNNHLTQQLPRISPSGHSTPEPRPNTDSKEKGEARSEYSPVIARGAMSDAKADTNTTVEMVHDQHGNNSGNSREFSSYTNEDSIMTLSLNKKDPTTRVELPGKATETKEERTPLDSCQDYNSAHFIGMGKQLADEKDPNHLAEENNAGKEQTSSSTMLEEEHADLDNIAEKD